MGRRALADKSFTYFALLEAFGKSGCPVCRLMEEYSLSYLDTLFYEQVNDVGTRSKLRVARGFCNWHAWQARRIASSALGVAIIAKDLITEEVTRLDALLRRSLLRLSQRASSPRLSKSALLRFLDGWRRKGSCPACEVILDHERHALETLLNFLPDQDFARRFETCAGLCVVHTVRAAEGNDSHPALRRLIELQRRTYTSLVAELEEFCRKHDYRFSHEAWRIEADSWLRAIELLAGRPDVFGNEVQRKPLGPAHPRWWIKCIERCLGWRSGEVPANSTGNREAHGCHSGLADQLSSGSALRQRHGPAHGGEKE